MTLIIASSVLGLGCGCPTIEATKQERKLTGHLTYQIAGASPITSDIGSDAYFLVNGDVSGAYPGEVAFEFAPDERTVTSAPPFFRFVARVAPGGDSDIDLSDDNSILTVLPSRASPPIPYLGVTGHMSLQGIDATCGLACPLRARGTLTISASGPDAEVFELASGAFVANDTVHDTGMCKPD